MLLYKLLLVILIFNFYTFSSNYYCKKIITSINKKIDSLSLDSLENFIEKIPWLKVVGAICFLNTLIFIKGVYFYNKNKHMEDKYPGHELNIGSTPLFFSSISFLAIYYNLKINVDQNIIKQSASASIAFTSLICSLIWLYHSSYFWLC